VVLRRDKVSLTFCSLKKLSNIHHPHPELVEGWQRPQGSQMDAATVYILECSDGSFYGGITRKTIEERVSEHQQGLLKGYTSTCRPVQLLWSEGFTNITEAVALERRIKELSRNKKKAMMAGNWQKLKILSNTKNFKTN
jgi:putative endonuclease